MRIMLFYGRLSASGYDKLYRKQNKFANPIKGGMKMLDSLILDIIKVGIQTEISNPYIILENEIELQLSNGMKVRIATEI